MVFRSRKLKISKKPEIGFPIRNWKNRTVANEPHKYCQVSILAIPEEGLRTHLKEFGFIKLFRKDLKKEDSRHYILYLPDEEKIKDITRSTFVTIHDTHWGIETFHRAIKYVEFVGSWLEIPVQSKLTYFVHFKHLWNWSLCALKK